MRISDWSSECALPIFSTVFGQAMVGIMQTDTAGNIIMVNKRYCEILGRSEENLRTVTMSDCTHPDDLAWNLPLLDEHKSDLKSFQLEKRYIRPDGSIVWCKVMVSFVIDIKDRKSVV